MGKNGLVFVAVLALVGACSAGFAFNNPEGVACCMRSYVRNTGTVNHAVNEDINFVNVEYTSDDGRRRRGLPFSTTFDLLDVISSGSVEPGDTVCVDSENKAFRKYVEYLESTVVLDRKRNVDEADQAFDCPIFGPNGPLEQVVTVKSKAECVLWQACNNVQYDLSECVPACEDQCGDGPIIGKRGFSDECFEECRLLCEYQCVGICFNDPDCIYDCVEDLTLDGDVGRPIGKIGKIGKTVSGDGKPPFLDGKPPLVPNDVVWYPGLLIDMAFGKPEYNPFFGILERDANSVARPAFHVRSNELEVSMSAYPGVKCKDIKDFCRVGPRRF